MKRNRSYGVKGTGGVDSHFSGTVESFIKKSRFNRDQVIKTTFNAGVLLPVYLDEVVPGDHFDVDLSFVSRMSTPLFPTMDNLELDFYFFFVPNRIVWNGWQALHGENTLSSWAPLNVPSSVPSIQANDISVVQSSKAIGDYYGLANNVVFDWVLPSSLPFRGYASIWNRWFRDQNFQAPIAINLGTTNDAPSTPAGSLGYLPNDPVLPVCKKHDYFTSSLPGSFKPVNTSGVQGTTPSIFVTQGTSMYPTSLTTLWNNLSSTSATLTGTSLQSYVQQLRTAFQLTKLLERDARGGTRYVEMLKAHFGVEAEDYRLQYPEFLGHMHSYVGMQQVAQTSGTGITGQSTPQANISAFSHTYGHKSLFKKSFVEHGFVHGFVVARQRKTYQQGVEKFWRRKTRFDFYYPELAHISEQLIQVYEIAADLVTNASSVTAPFGVQEAWGDMRFKPNRVSGEFRSNAVNSLDPWHYADYYTSIPAMSDAFIRDNSRVNVDRTLAVTSSVADQIILDLKVHNKATRPLPIYSVPGFVDHF